jgi:hypothetical protein
MREGREAGAERLQELDLDGRVVPVVVAADDVGDGEIGVVDHRGRLVGPAAIGLAQHRVAERAALDG